MEYVFLVVLRTRLFIYSLLAYATIVTDFVEHVFIYSKLTYLGTYLIYVMYWIML